MASNENYYRAPMCVSFCKEKRVGMAPPCDPLCKKDHKACPLKASARRSRIAYELVRSGAGMHETVCHVRTLWSVIS
jgi:hypothetical protein